MVIPEIGTTGEMTAIGADHPAREVQTADAITKTVRLRPLPAADRWIAGSGVLTGPKLAFGGARGVLHTPAPAPQRLRETVVLIPNTGALTATSKTTRPAPLVVGMASLIVTGTRGLGFARPKHLAIP